MSGLHHQCDPGQTLDYQILLLSVLSSTGLVKLYVLVFNDENYLSIHGCHGREPSVPVSVAARH